MPVVDQRAALCMPGRKGGGESKRAVVTIIIIIQAEMRLALLMDNICSPTYLWIKGMLDREGGENLGNFSVCEKERKKH